MHGVADSRREAGKRLVRPGSSKYDGRRYWTERQISTVHILVVSEEKEAGKAPDEVGRLS